MGLQGKDLGFDYLLSMLIWLYFVVFDGLLSVDRREIIDLFDIMI